MRALADVYGAQLAYLTDSSRLHETVDAVAAAADELSALGDDAGFAKASHVQAGAFAQLGQVGAAEAALDRALAAARNAGDAPPRERRARGRAARGALGSLAGGAGERPLPRRRADPAHDAGQPPPRGRRAQLPGGARGDARARRRGARDARRLPRDVRGARPRLRAARERGPRRDRRAARRRGRGRRGSPARRRTRASTRSARGREPSAPRRCSRGRCSIRAATTRPTSSRGSARSAGGEDLKATIAWCGVRAEVLARRGEHEAAEELARRGAEMAAQTDALTDHADARMALAAVLRAAGRDDEAAERGAARARALRGEGERGRARGGQRRSPASSAPRPRRRSGPPAAVTARCRSVWERLTRSLHRGVQRPRRERARRAR